MTAAQTEIDFLPDADIQAIQEENQGIFGAVTDDVRHVPHRKHLNSSTSTAPSISGRPTPEPKAITQRYFPYGQLRPADEKTNSLRGNADFSLLPTLSERHNKAFVNVRWQVMNFIEPGVVADLSRLQEPYCAKSRFRG